ncbi:MAG: S41 family peptidase [Myxococcota bacterium]
MNTPTALLVGISLATVGLLTRGAPDEGPYEAVVVGDDAHNWLSRAEAAADLRAWQSAVLELHPAMQDPRARAVFAQRVDALIASLPEVVARARLHKKWAAVAAAFGDSHTAVLPTVDMAVHDPLPIVADGRRLCLAKPYRSAPTGACFTRFGTRTAASAIEWIDTVTPHESEDSWRVMAPSLLPFALAELGVPADATAVLEDADGAWFEVALPAMGTMPKPNPLDALNLRIDAHGIAHITLRTMVGSHQAHFQKAFERMFATLAQNPPRGIVVDVRGNDGGSTTVGDQLLAYLTKTPYRMMAQKHWRVSAAMQARIRQHGGGFENYLAASVGSTLPMEVSELPPSGAPFAYTGPVVFLADHRTRSAAMMMLDAVKTYRLGLIIGEAPASPPNYFGEVYSYTASHTGFRVSISTAAFVRANGNASDGSGVAPDLPVATTLEDRVAGRDPVRARAIAAVEYWHEVRREAATSKAVDEAVE